MSSIKEFRIDAFSYPMDSSHLIIKSDGEIRTFIGNKVLVSKMKSKAKFFKELENALILDFKSLGDYKESKQYYHISVIYDDGKEESHFYIENLSSNNQIYIKDVLIRYVLPENLIDVVSS